MVVLRIGAYIYQRLLYRHVNQVLWIGYSKATE